MSLLNTIKKASVGAVNAGNPVNVLFGTVTDANPLAVQIDQKTTLSQRFLVVPESITRLEISLQHVHEYSGGGTTETALNAPVVIRRGLAVGDKVLLLRMQGGQSYVVLDRVVS
ncbi:DUF2577 domain-containing protein [Xylanibacillus composti]|uniref:DUF2577 domain-containing protein n=1 Tax=Xylanibacillus composti TaxID=1572762 RepID=A0A8J4H4C2_9BACL|nr:DUF2577 domain-containing protein [Xylanibacillus composti]MDT9723759.1 DUF2577 domain-containing protein [Xylanibacillus composti]GIQ70772.1 hypothetical protein XYCOK13_35960 [Xylanibacillus composti]